MNQTFDLERYQKACKALLGKTIVIYATDADFTPAGKRTYRVVRHTLDGKPNLDLTRDWQQAG
jgi:hypothetical protein